MTRLLSTWRGWLFAIFAAVLLTACDPIVDIVAPTEVEVGVPVAFSNERLPQFKDAEFTDLQYEWDFGDGGKASGPQAIHTYAQPGEYEVVLSVSDASVRGWGQAYISKKTIKVGTYTGALVPVSVRVYDDNGRSVQGATVSMGEQSAQTDLAGGVLITPAQPTVQPVVVIRKSGYLTQSVRVPDGQPSERGVIVTLKKEAPALAVDDIAAAQTVAPQDANLSPSVTLPAQAFVNAKGEPVSGVASVRITPWDITSQSDMAAFPGDAKADDGAGHIVDLVSFGMLSIEFEQGGEKLQLAPGKKAVISMQLPITHDVQGRAIEVGDTIPLWHFNETRGVWEREGDGVVVASEASWTGLAVRAEVGHFSSWNWDKIAEPDVSPVTRAITCRVPDGRGGYMPLDADDLCVIRIDQLRPNGQFLTSSLSVKGAQSVEYGQFVSDAAVTLRGEAVLAGYRGQATWTVTSADAAEPLLLDLTDRLIVSAVVGQVPVVTAPPVKVRFYVSQDGYRVVDSNGVKVYTRSLVDGALSEVAFPVYVAYDWVFDESDMRPGFELYQFQLYGGGDAAGQDAQGRFSGTYIVKLPVQRDFQDNGNGQYVSTRTEWLEAEVTIASRVYSGAALLRDAEQSLTFALWDEVGVSTPIKTDSIVEVRLQVADDGWLSGDLGEWRRVSAPFRDERVVQQNQFAMVNGPYFHVPITCNDLAAPFLGAHVLKMYVRVTDPATGQSRVYDTQPFKATVESPACT